MLQHDTYKQRNPSSTDLYKLIEANYESFINVYDERYEKEYGYLRYNVADIIYHYLDCGILDNGFARVRCTNPECGHEYLLAFSCKSRCICTSCHAKRSVILAERIAEEVVMPVNHRHWVFTIPKLLRGYFRRNRKLNSILFESAIFAIKTYFVDELGIKDGKTGAILYMQSFGKTGNPHSHLHGVIANGLFDKDGNFHEVQEIYEDAIRELFKNKLFEILLERDIIYDQIINIFSLWRHTGFDVHYERKIDGSDLKVVEDIIRYITRPPISAEKVKYDSEANTVTYKGKTFNALDFLAQLVSHIPNTGEQIIRFYGVYSNAYKGRANRSDIELVEVMERRRKNKYWARLIQKLFGVNPILCSKCKSEMKIISFIQDPRIITKILDHLGLYHSHDPPPKPPPKLYNQDSVYNEPFPTYDDYLCDPEPKMFYPDPVYEDFYFSQISTRLLPTEAIWGDF
ncbi:MAG: transposase zinc-binding domain-containing protein [Planctomycetes bacterium]|nr:transposase zinc-binding domain-containing protein [Planctomycetota bacterium]